MTATSHRHEWEPSRVLLIRPTELWHETEKAWEMMNHNQAMYPRTEVTYKRCGCGKVLF